MAPLSDFDTLLARYRAGGRFRGILTAIRPRPDVGQDVILPHSFIFEEDT